MRDVNGNLPFVMTVVDRSKCAGCTAPTIADAISSAALKKCAAVAKPDLDEDAWRLDFASSDETAMQARAGQLSPMDFVSWCQGQLLEAPKGAYLRISSSYGTKQVTLKYPDGSSRPLGNLGEGVSIPGAVEAVPEERCP